MPAVNVYIDEDLHKWLERERGLVKRSTFIADILTKVKDGELVAKKR